MGVTFEFEKGYPASFGDDVDVVVEHSVAGKTKDFKLFIYGA